MDEWYIAIKIIILIIIGVFVICGLSGKAIFGILSVVGIVVICLFMVLKNRKIKTKEICILIMGILIIIVCLIFATSLFGR